MRQKFFISFNSADRTKAHWIAWTLKESGHEVAVHDWEIPAGGNAPLWMNTKLAWADRLIAVISPDYVPARYSPMEWAPQIWNDPDGTKGSVIPVIVRPTSKMPPLLKDLSRIDLTNCSEAEAKRRLIEGVDMPAPPERKPAFETIEGDPPDSHHTGPPEKPTFTQVNVQARRLLKVSAAIAVLALGVIPVFAVFAFFFGNHASERECKTTIGGTVVCGDYKDQRTQERNWLPAGGRSGAAVVDETALGEAIGVLAKEKSAAEQYAVVLATVGKKHVDTYLRGVTLYADAKADFDGLIEQLRFSLRDGYNPTKSDKYTAALNGAAEKRVAFTKFVSHDVIGKIEGKKPGLPDVISAVPELIKVINDAGVSIWTAFHDAGKEKRDAILADVDRLRWKSFGELAPS